MSEDAPIEQEDYGLGQDEAPEQIDSESSPDTGDNQEEKIDGVQKRINKYAAKAYAAERRAEEAEAKLQSQAAEKPQQIADAPKAPSYPTNAYDEDAMKQYHNDMLAYSQSMATAASKATFQEYQQSTANTAKQTAQQQVVSDYAKNAIADGVDMEKLRIAESALNQAGVSNELGSYLMKDRNGGKIAEYLYDNPDEMHAILAMDPVSAGIKIATEIKAKALSKTPKVSGAPDPTPEITGGGMVGKDDFDQRYPGTTFN